MIGELEWEDDLFRLPDEYRAVVMAHSLRSARVEWAEPALLVRPWVRRSGPRGAASVHRPSCALGVDVPASTSFDAPLLSIVPHSELCRVCVTSEEHSWWMLAHTLHKVVPALGILHELSVAPSWQLVLRALPEADRLLLWAEHPERLSDPLLRSYVERSGSALHALALEHAHILPGFMGAVSTALAAAWQAPGSEAFRELVGEAFAGPVLEPLPDEEGPEALVGMAYLSSHLLLTVLLLRYGAVAQSGTKRLLRVPRPLAEELFPPAGLGRGHCWMPSPKAEVSPEAWETTLSLWEPWERSEPFGSLAVAFESAVGVHGGLR